MNLYKEIFTHYAPRDQETGTKKYFIAENDMEAYHIVYGRGDCVTVDQVDCKESLVEFDGKEYFYINGKEYPTTLTIEDTRKIVAEARGEIFMDDMNYDDLYYGKTYSGWVLEKEGISDAEIETLKNLYIIT